MSYDITLCDPVTGDVLHTDAPHRMRGGTYSMSGTDEMWLNVTYNYADWYYRPGVFPAFEDEEFANGRSGIRSIYKMTGAESIPVLQHAIAALEAFTDDISEDERKERIRQDAGGYWMPTKANAIKPLYQLLAMAQMRPDGVWEGD